MHTRRHRELTWFYQAEDPNWELSNWYPCKFEYAGIRYTSLEQFMMYQKAMIIGDSEAAQRILSTDSPKEAKRIARNIKSEFFSNWQENKYFIVKMGVRAKLLQNKNILDLLLSTGDSIIVEASETDDIWGIGEKLDLEDRMITFKGKNYMGRIYMELRNEFRSMISRGIELKYIDFRNCSNIKICDYSAYELYNDPLYHQAIKYYEKHCFNLHINSFFSAMSLYEYSYAFDVTPGVLEVYQMLFDIYYSNGGTFKEQEAMSVQTCNQDTIPCKDCRFAILLGPTAGDCVKFKNKPYDVYFESKDCKEYEKGR